MKCCGITRVDDALAAARCGFDAIGLVFAARSKRRLDLAQAVALRRQLPLSLKVVALLMDNDAAEVSRVLKHLQPDLLQFHGSESDAWCAQFGAPWLKAVAMGDGADALAQLHAWPHADALLLDGHRAGRLGGEGQPFDWSLVPGELAQPWILAGGLDADNVAAAIRRTRPWGVDVSSGVETSPGCKDGATMQRFAAAVHACAEAFSGNGND